MNNSVPSYRDIEDARKKIYPYMEPTPVFRSEAIDKECGVCVDFKMENLMPDVGAFKFRGAMHAILCLTDVQRAAGVATHSSGNHGQALAKAAKLLTIPAFVVMPRTAKDIKKRGVREFGAAIIESEPTQEAREAKLSEVQKGTGAHIVHPYNDYRVIAGQATAMRELIDDHKRDTSVPYKAIYAPVGGGGLLSGTALAAHYFSPQTRVIGAEPEGADDAFRSMQSGKIERNKQVNTIADGLSTNLGDKTFQIIREYVDRITLVTDDEIKESMRILWERLRVIVEPSGATAFAALRKEIRTKKSLYTTNNNVAVIVSGGNVDLEDIAFLKK